MSTKARRLIKKDGKGFFVCFVFGFGFFFFGGGGGL